MTTDDVGLSALLFVAQMLGLVIGLGLILGGAI